MGVLSCSRFTCENIMCDRYSEIYGYICWECFKELCELGVNTNIEEFLTLEKTYTNKEATKSYFSAIFPES